MHVAKFKIQFHLVIFRTKVWCPQIILSSYAHELTYVRNILNLFRGALICFLIKLSRTVIYFIYFDSGAVMAVSVFVTKMVWPLGGHIKRRQLYWQ